MPITVPDDRRPVGALTAELLATDRGDEVAAAVLAALTTAQQPDVLDDAHFGPAPSTADLAHATTSATLRMHDARRALLADSLSRAEAAARLGIGPQQISKLLAAGELLALEDGRELRLPAWQFDPDTPRGRLEGLRAVATAFAGGPVTLSLWAARPNPALGGRTPARALAQGDLTAVVTAATAGV